MKLKSGTKKKSKARVLIVFGKGIASTLALELAMLFSHSGAEVRAAFIDNGGEWLAEAPLKQVCGHSVLTATHQPGWFFAELPFDATVVITPSSLTQQQLVTGITADPVVNFIIRHSQIIRILQTRQLMPAEADSAAQHLNFIELPAQPLHFSLFFQKVLASVIAQLSARARLGKKTFSLCHNVPDPLKAVVATKPAWVQRLTGALTASGLKQHEHETAKDKAIEIAISAYDGPAVDASGKLHFVIPALTHQHNAGMTVTFVAAQIADEAIHGDYQHIYIKRLSNGLMLFDKHGPRLLPDLTGQCCYSRLAAYLATSLSRETQTIETQPE